MAFDPSKPFEEVGAPTATLDRTQPYEEVQGEHNFDVGSLLLDPQRAHQHATPEGKAAINTLMATAGDEEGKMRATNQLYVNQHMPSMPVAALTSNWPAVRDGYAKSLGYTQGQISEQGFTQLLQQKEEAKKKDEWAVTDAFGKLKAMFGLEGYGDKVQRFGIPLGAEVAGTTGQLATIPRMDGKGTLAGIVNAVNRVSASLVTPENAAALVTTGGAGEVATILGTARAMAVARATQAAVLGTFTATGAKATVDAMDDVRTVFADPDSTKEKKADAIATVVLSGLMTAAAAKGTYDFGAKAATGESAPPPDIGKQIEAATFLRDQAKKAPPEMAAVLTEAAKQVEPAKAESKTPERAKYEELQGQMIEMVKEGKAGTEEFNKVWQASEDIKSQNEGMPPGEKAGGPVEPPPEEPEAPTEAPEPGDTTGIAHRVSEDRGVAAERGEGISASDSIEHGRELLKEGLDPEVAVAEHANHGAISGDAMALVRARAEELSKPMQTEWHKIGQAQQGETDIDTGTFHGLQRAYHESSGKTFTPEQAVEATKQAGEVKGATEAVEATKKKLVETATGPEQPKVRKVPKSISDAASAARERIRQRLEKLGTAQFVEGEKSGVLSKEMLDDLGAVGAEYVAKGIVKAADFADAMVREFGERIRPHLEAILQKAKELRDQAKASDPLTTHTAGSKWTNEQAASLWNKAKEKIDAGQDFDDVRHDLAKETGLPVADITEGLASPKGVRPITDELYAKMSERRRVVNQAKQWVTNEKYPGWFNFAKNVPGFFFNLATFGHGTVGMVTHAGNQMFNPSAVANYWKAFGQQFKLLGWHDSGAYHERMMQDLTRDPLFIKAKRAGLANDPFKYQDDYQNAGAVKFFKKVGLSGNRGFDALKLFRQQRFNERWESLPADLKTPEMAKALADIGNHETGVVRSTVGGSSANWILFAPKLEASRWAFLLGDPAKATKTFINWKGETPEARAAAVEQVKQKALIAGTYVGALAINQGFLSASGSDEKINFTDPRHGDWLSFKVAGHRIGVISPMIGSVRFLANVIHDSMGDRSKFEKMQGSRFEQATKDAGQYLRGKESPFAKVATDTAFQADFKENPMPWSNDAISKHQKAEGVHKFTYAEYAGKNLTPIPLQEAITEVWKKQGMNEDQITTVLNAIIIAASVGGTGIKISEDTPYKKPLAK